MFSEKRLIFQYREDYQAEVEIPRIDPEAEKKVHEIFVELKKLHLESVSGDLLLEDTRWRRFDSIDEDVNAHMLGKLSQIGRQLIELEDQGFMSEEFQKAKEIFQEFVNTYEYDIAQTRARMEKFDIKTVQIFFPLTINEEDLVHMLYLVEDEEAFDWLFERIQKLSLGKSALMTLLAYSDGKINPRGFKPAPVEIYFEAAQNFAGDQLLARFSDEESYSRILRCGNFEQKKKVALEVLERDDLSEEMLDEIMGIEFPFQIIDKAITRLLEHDSLFLKHIEKIFTEIGTTRPEVTQKARELYLKLKAEGQIYHNINLDVFYLVLPEYRQEIIDNFTFPKGESDIDRFIKLFRVLPFDRSIQQKFLHELASAQIDEEIKEQAFIEIVPSTMFALLDPTLVDKFLDQLPDYGNYKDTDPDNVIFRPIITENLDLFKRLYKHPYLQKKFLENKNDLSYANAFSIVIAMIRYEEEGSGFTLDTDAGIAAVFERVWAEREAFKKKVILGPTQKLVVFTHEEERFWQGNVIDFAKKCGVEEVGPGNFQGPGHEKEILKQIKESDVIWFSGHGSSKKLGLGESPPASSGVQDDIEPWWTGIDYKELGDMLLDSGDIENKTIILDSCFAYDFVKIEGLFKYLRNPDPPRKPSVVMPTVITVSGEANFSFGGGIVDDSFFLQALILEHSEGQALTGADILRAEGRFFYLSDMGIFLGPSGVEVSQNEGVEKEKTA